jgi:signal transduction histidine kinase
MRLWCALLLCWWASVAWGQSPEKAVKEGPVTRILVVHNQAQQHPWIRPFDLVLHQSLQKAGERTQIYIEHLDIARFPSPDNQANFQNYLIQKYAEQMPDIMVGNGAPAVNLLTQVRERFGKAIPLLGVGFVSGLSAKARNAEDFVMADSVLDIDATMRQIVTLRPGTRHVAIVGQLPQKALNEALQNYLDRDGWAEFGEARRVSATRINDVIAQVKAMPPDTAILLFGYLTDDRDTPLGPTQTTQELAQKLSVPIFGLYDSAMGAGMVGGRLMSGIDQAKVVVDLLQRLIHGESINRLPRTVVSNNRDVFDHVQLERFGIAEDLLPPGSEVINRPPSLYETNPLVVTMTIAGIIVLVVILGALAVLMRSRARSAQVMERANSELEQRMIERSGELKQAMEQLMHSEKLAALGSLVAGIAHELNTPLGNAYTVTTTFQEHSRDMATVIESDQLRRAQLTTYMAQAKDAGEIIERNMKRAIELVMSFKQIAVDQSSERRRSFDLAELVKETLLTLSPGLRHEPVHIACQIDSQLRFDSYPGALIQVLTNLINNAVIHGRGERADLSISINGAVARREGFATLSVSDNGVGMSAEVRKRIFDPFFTTRMGQGGSGLGLYLVDNLVTDALGGRIEVHSEPEAGARFDIELPLQAPQMPVLA